MATESTQPRRYITRARARASDNLIDIKQLHQQKGQKAPEKQKVTAIISTELSARSDAAPPAPRTTKTSQRTVLGTTTETKGVKAAPKRKSAKNDGGASKKITSTRLSTSVADAKSVKQVTFNDDKENVVPLRREDTMTGHGSDDTDELMSSMGALSVKPLRVPSTRLRLPSMRTTKASPLDPLPALSPSKARRPPRVIIADHEMEDELSSPMSPVLKLAAKPKRGKRATSLFPQGYTETTGAPGLRKPLDLSATLLTTPARRPTLYSFNQEATNTPFLKYNTEVSNTGLGSSLASPAKRLPSAAMLVSPRKDDIHNEPKVALQPDCLDTGFRSPPKRARARCPVKTDEMEDELAMDLDDCVLGRSTSKLVGKDKSIQESMEKNSGNSTNTKSEKGVSGLSGASDLSIAVPIAIHHETHSCMSGAKAGQERQERDVSSNNNAPAKHSGYADHARSCVTPAAAKSTSWIGGTSNYCFLDHEADEYELLDYPTTVTSFSTSLMTELRIERKNLFPSGVAKNQREDRVPIDPFLLTFDVPDRFLGAIESPTQKITVPVKLHSIDDTMCEDDDRDDRENHFSGISKTSTRNNHDGSLSRPNSVARISGVLAGAVVFLDVYTAEGADASSTFAEALQGLGAKVLKSWNWNPNSAGPLGEGERKIGITHVVFKDGSPRTLQKVKDSKGVVLCVGVGWVTSCEEEQAWIDESIYPVDLDHIPRGGHRRRKSMEPKSLIVIPIDGSSLGAASGPPACASAPQETPHQTPKRSIFAQTEQQKQKIDYNPLVMQNLLMARRKSMQFAPKIGSPLRRFATFTLN